MSEEQETQKIDLTPASPRDLDGIAKTLDEFRKVFAETAQSMRDEDVPLIHVKGLPSLKYAIERLNGVRGSVQKALVEARTTFIGKPKASAQAYLDEHASEIPEATRKVAEKQPDYKKPKTKRTGKKSS